jgi:hypothetical protein
VRTASASCADSGHDRECGTAGCRVAVVEDASQDGDGVTVQLVPLTALRGVVDGGDGGHVRGVRVAAAAHPHMRPRLIPTYGTFAPDGG